MENFDAIASTLDGLFAKVNLDKITADSTGFSALPDGYYLCDIVKADLDETKEKHLPIFKFQLKVCEDGLSQQLNVETGEVALCETKGTKNRVIFKNWTIFDENALNTFISDMLKFEDPDDGSSLLEKEYFRRTETTLDALDSLIDVRNYVMLQTITNKKGVEEQKVSIVKWSAAKDLGLPC